MSALQLFIRGVAVCALLGAPAIGTDPSQAHGKGDSFTYAKSQPNLCRNINNAIHRHARPYLIKMTSVRGTNDFVDDRNGFSLRTCDWKVRSGWIYYRCSSSSSNQAWKAGITGSGEDGNRTKNRVTSKMICDGKERGVHYRWPFLSNTHVHLWAPSESSLVKNVTIRVPE